MQKKITFYHDKDIDMLNLGCTLPNLAKLCLHKSRDTNFYPLTGADKDLLEKKLEDVVARLSMVFTRKAVVKETSIRKSTGIQKSGVGIDAIQLYSYSMCQTVRTGLYTHWDLERETGRFDLNRTRPVALKIWSSFFQRTRPDFKIECFYTLGRQKKSDCFSVDGVWSHCSSVFETMDCFYHFFLSQGVRPSLSEDDFQRGTKKRELVELGQSYIRDKGFTVIKMWWCVW